MCEPKLWTALCSCGTETPSAVCETQTGHQSLVTRQELTMQQSPQTTAGSLLLHPLGAKGPGKL